MDCQVTGLPVTVTQLLGTKPYPPGNYCKSLANVFKVNVFNTEVLVNMFAGARYFKRPTLWLGLIRTSTNFFMYP